MLEQEIDGVTHVLVPKEMWDKMWEVFDRIEFRNVTFSYDVSIENDKCEKVLDSINFFIKKREDFRFLLSYA